MIYLYYIYIENIFLMFELFKTNFYDSINENDINSIINEFEKFINIFYLNIYTNYDDEKYEKLLTNIYNKIDDILKKLYKYNDGQFKNYKNDYDEGIIRNIKSFIRIIKEIVFEKINNNNNFILNDNGVAYYRPHSTSLRLKFYNFHEFISIVTNNNEKYLTLKNSYMKIINSIKDNNKIDINKIDNFINIIEKLYVYIILFHIYIILNLSKKEDKSIDIEYMRILISVIDYMNNNNIFINNDLKFFINNCYDLLKSSKIIGGSDYQIDPPYMYHRNEDENNKYNINDNIKPPIPITVNNILTNISNYNLNKYSIVSYIKIIIFHIFAKYKTTGGNNKTKLINTKLVRNLFNMKFKIYFDPTNDIFIGKYKKNIIYIKNPYSNDKKEIQLLTKKYLINNKIIKNNKNNIIFYIRYKNDYEFVYNPITNKKYKILKKNIKLFKEVIKK